MKFNLYWAGGKAFHKLTDASWEVYSGGTEVWFEWTSIVGFQDIYPNLPSPMP